MRNIILDFFLHFPSLYHIIDNSIYICSDLEKFDVKKDILTKKFCDKYKIEYQDIIPDEKYNICFIIFPLFNLDSKHKPIRHIIFNNTLETYSNKIKANKI